LYQQPRWLLRHHLTWRLTFIVLLMMRLLNLV
jgi:hypothetical protein